jgi:flagellar basal body-associated protein FliL
VRKKLKIVVPLLLVLAGGGYKFVLAKPADGPPPKVHGDVYVLGKDFLINLDGNRYAKLGVALVVEPGAAAPAEGGGHGGAAPKPPDGYGTLPQEAVARGVVTDVLTGAGADELKRAARRAGLKRRILRALRKRSDIPVEDVLFTDVAVQ